MVVYYFKTLVERNETKRGSRIRVGTPSTLYSRILKICRLLCVHSILSLPWCVCKVLFGSIYCYYFSFLSCLWSPDKIPWNVFDIYFFQVIRKTFNPSLTIQLGIGGIRITFLRYFSSMLYPSIQHSRTTKTQPKKKQLKPKVEGRE